MPRRGKIICHHEVRISTAYSTLRGPLPDAWSSLWQGSAQGLKKKKNLETQTTYKEIIFKSFREL